MKRGGGICRGIHASIIIEEEGNDKDDIAHWFHRVKARRSVFTATIDKKHPPWTQRKRLLVGIKNDVTFIHISIFTSTEEKEKAEDMMI